MGAEIVVSREKGGVVLYNYLGPLSSRTIMLRKEGGCQTIGGTKNYLLAKGLIYIKKKRTTERY
jgi:hypothetical protein